MNILLSLKGLAIGIAEIIPGVSGGTIAFITGIYERLLNAIQAWNFQNISRLFKGDIKGFWKAIDGKFIFQLGIGMLTGMVIGAFAISYLLVHYIEPLLGFFFGLILASVQMIIRQVHKWSLKNMLFLIGGTFFALWVVMISPTSGNLQIWYIFISGFIAICALMLPGISGSFMLLILGMYTTILAAFKGVMTNFNFDQFFILIVFGFGLILGAATFSRVISWTLKKFHQQTLMALTGFMIGSLWKIWPWRIPATWLNKITNEIESDRAVLETLSKSDYKIISEEVVFPQDYFVDHPKIALTITTLAFGFFLVISLDYYFSKRQNKEVISQ
ncbi:MAG TPA: DUF368 domain-containing protein [Saprospiraceae bacterium]|nr:DUF368 domain-containing protein [Saprospirales bacterium]HRQ30048.1 DUF368 domain-containing protein [Saprospiraceae bacterium]